jgi:prepilin peptidase dependent protein B
MRTHLNAHAPPPRPGRRRIHGLSLVELLIGLALSLFMLSAGIALLTSHLHENSALIVEARLMQDLHAASAAVARDLRRAGHWGEARAGLWQPATATRINPYQGLPPAAGPVDAITLRYSRDRTENHQLDANESFGFRLRAQGIDLLLGDGNWQALTDTGTVLVTRFQLTPRHDEVLASLPCDKPCPDPLPPGQACPPRLQVRHYTLTLAGRSALDSRVERSLQSTVRVRNDALIGQCPS